MKKLVAAALLGMSMFAAVPAQAVTLISMTTQGSGASLVRFYTYSATFIDNHDGTGAVDLGSIAPAKGLFVVRYRFNTPLGWLTSSGNTASTRLSTDVDFEPVTSNAVVYGPVRLNGVLGQVQNEMGGTGTNANHIGNSIWKWPDGTLVATQMNPQVLEISGRQYGTGRITGEVSFVAVPEPATWSLFLLGFGLIGAAARRRRPAAAIA